MKRSFLFLLILICAVLAACGEPPTVAADFSADFAVAQDEAAYKGSLTLSGGDLMLTFSEPYTVQGMQYDYSADGLQITYAGHSTAANSDYIPSGAVPQVLHNALAYLPQASYTESDENGDRFTLPTPYGDVYLTATDGLPVSLDDPRTGLLFTFTASRSVKEDP